MLLGKIGKISGYKQIMDIAVIKANKAAELEREKVKRKSRIDKSIGIELKRINSLSKEINTIMMRIIKNFPSFDDLHIFYQEMLTLHFDIEEVKKSLGAVQWVSATVNKLERESAAKIKNEKSFRLINPIRRQFFARSDSVVKRVSKDLILLDKVRKYLRDMPVIKTKMFTISIVGFPNVGKTTLLSKLTGSTPDISPIPFTTKRLNLGYYKKLIQFIDTPGTLNKFEKMNEIEKLAFLSMKYLAHVIVYVYDATGEYPWDDLVALDNEIKNLHKPIVYFLSKNDILSEEKAKEIKNEIKGIIVDKDELLVKLEEMEMVV